MRNKKQKMNGKTNKKGFILTKFKNLLYTSLILVLIFSLSGSVSTLPDMAVTNLSYSPENPVECENLTVNVTVKNFGSDMLLANTSLMLLIDGSVVSSDNEISRLTAGEQINLPIYLTADDTCDLAGGNHTLTAIVDPLDNLAESNEDNNERNATVRIYVKPKMKYISLAGGYRLPGGQTFGNNPPNDVGGLYAKVIFSTCPGNDCTGRDNVKVKATIIDSSDVSVYTINLDYNHDYGIWIGSFDVDDINSALDCEYCDYTINWNVTESYATFEITFVFDDTMPFSVDRKPPSIGSIGCENGDTFTVSIEDQSGVKSAIFYVVDDGKIVYRDNIKTEGNESVGTKVARPYISGAVDVDYYINATDRLGNTGNTLFEAAACVYVVSPPPAPPAITAPAPVTRARPTRCPGRPEVAPLLPPVIMPPLPTPIPPIIPLMPPLSIPPIPPPNPPTIPVVPVLAEAVIVNCSY